MHLTELHAALRRHNEGISSTRMLKILQAHEAHFGTLDRITRRRMQRQAVLAHLKGLAEPCPPLAYVWRQDSDYSGPVVAVWTWSRDCDMCEGTDRSLIPATSGALDEFLDSLYANAEGPVSWSLHAPSEHFQSTFRDRALEAFEDGHPHVIYG